LDEILLRLVKQIVYKDDYIWYFVNTSVPSVNYCDGLDRCILYCILFVFMFALLCFCVVTEFSANKDLYKLAFAKLGSPPSPTVSRRLCAPRFLPGNRRVIQLSQMKCQLDNRPACQPNSCSRIAARAARFWLPDNYHRTLINFLHMQTDFTVLQKKYAITQAPTITLYSSFFTNR